MPKPAANDRDSIDAPDPERERGIRRRGNVAAGRGERAHVDRVGIDHPGSPLATLRARLFDRAERMLPALTRLRRSESLPILLERHRIYVLPTGFGIGFSVLLFVMLIGALNYSNNPAILLTCLFGAAGGASLFIGFRNLSGLRLVQLRADECHAGDQLKVELRFATQRARPSIRITVAGSEMACALRPGDRESTVVTLATTTRGWLRPGRLRIASDYPLGLFRVWSWLHPDAAFLVFPKPEHEPPALPMLSGRLGEQSAHGNDEDYAGLRDYRASDPPRLIAWKASARHDHLLVRESEPRAGTALVLDYARLTGINNESRISRLTAWVLAAERSGASYTVNLPDATIGPGTGPAHRFACLRALALLPGDE